MITFDHPVFWLKPCSLLPAAVSRAVRLRGWPGPEVSPRYNFVNFIDKHDAVLFNRVDVLFQLFRVDQQQPLLQ